MAHSQTQPMEITCPKCDNKFVADIWLVVDVWERPDLAEILQRGILHFLTCPKCQKQIITDTPLLVYRPYAQPPFLLSLPTGTKKKKAQYYASSLLSQLREAMPGEWEDAWLQKKSVKTIDRTELRVLMNLDTVLIGRQMIDAEEREAAFDRGDVHPTITALWEMIEAETWADSQGVVMAHPELLSDETDKTIEELVAGALNKGDPEAAAIFGQNREFLRRCRQVGAEAATSEFQEKKG